MSCRIKVDISVTSNVVARVDAEHLPPAQNEAAALLVLLEHGALTVEDVRLLIQVPADEEKTLRAFAEKNPLAGRLFLSVIEFRRRVLEEFDRLAARVTIATIARRPTHRPSADCVS